MILFIILEGILRAPQIACKMYLKTSEHMPVHGSDGIHMQLGSSANKLQLIWGESKLYQSLPSALNEICSSIASFVAEIGGRAPRHRDIDIIKNHIALPDGDLKKAILEYFDPYSDASNHREEAWACFVGFDYNVFKEYAEKTPHEWEEYFKKRYQKRVAAACKLFANKIRAAGLGHLTFYFFLIPMPCVEALRTKFFNKLGVAR